MLGTAGVEDEGLSSGVEVIRESSLGQGSSPGMLCAPASPVKYEGEHQQHERKPEAGQPNLQ